MVEVSIKRADKENGQSDGEDEKQDAEGAHHLQTLAAPIDYLHVDQEANCDDHVAFVDQGDQGVPIDCTIQLARCLVNAIARVSALAKAWCHKEAQDVEQIEEEHCTQIDQKVL